jgi:hypothetical protein
MKVGYCHNNKKTITNFLSGKKEGRRKISCGFFFFTNLKRFFEILAHKLKQTHVCCSLFLGWGIYWEIIFWKPNSKGYFHI